jgi:NTE family protein
VGGGSLGSIQVGMLRALAAHGIAADMAVGCSVGALNAAYYAGTPTAEGVEQLAKIWLSLRADKIYFRLRGAQCSHFCYGETFWFPRTECAS